MSDTINKILEEIILVQKKDPHGIITNVELIRGIAKKVINAIKDSQKIIDVEEIFRVFVFFPDYSFVNCLLIYDQFPNAISLATYSTWNTKYRRKVLEGQKAIKIISPIVKKVGSEDLDITKYEISGFRVIPVFDITQTRPISPRYRERVPPRIKEIPIYKEPRGEEIIEIKRHMFDILYDYIESSNINIEFKGAREMGELKVTADKYGIYINSMYKEDKHDLFFPLVAAYSVYREHYVFDEDTNTYVLNDKFNRGHAMLESESVTHIVAKHIGVPHDLPESHYIIWRTRDEYIEGLQNVHALSREVIQILTGKEIIIDTLGD